MSDITKFIGGDPEKMEMEEHLSELDEWNEDIGRTLANEEGIQMTDPHWEVVHFLRHHYLENGRTERARDLSQLLDDRFDEQGGRKYLYGLFPNGPVRQASRIAGLPVPSDSTDPSFGSVQ